MSFEGITFWVLIFFAIIAGVILEVVVSIEKKPWKDLLIFCGMLLFILWLMWIEGQFA
ncbi:hypothetical protein [Gimesia aquarii]|uniref:Uncharacterized protein n=1 Tax=Gimesia aquarii TaxID=2527964 RepID=A0A517WNK8_9PLAN|nr:hypothetical protein [Gimesia aquarii]QDU06844.1 hypothetical protein V202x_01870 [Gimesia aquarii]